MKKLIMLLLALATVAGAEAQNVVIVPSKGAIAYHKSKDCSYLNKSSDVKSVRLSEAKDMGRHPCVRCYPEQKEQTLKNIAKEKKTAAKTKTVTAEKPKNVKEKTVAKKETETAKKTATSKTTSKTKAETKITPERDEKGRFIKKKETKTKPAAKSPERDAKGRFVKKSEKAA